MRPDLEAVAEFIPRGVRVLDLGCGEGELLAHLQTHRQVNGYGLDVDADNILTCIRQGVNVIEQDLDAGLTNFPDDSFDMVVMTETLQSVRHPAQMLDEMLRIGNECIVTFPNFGHWRSRWHLLLQGRMPMVRHLPHSWYETPNIHLCTFKDFEQLVRDQGLHVIQRLVVGADHRRHPMINLMPNLFGAIALYQLGRAGAA